MRSAWRTRSASRTTAGSMPVYGSDAGVIAIVVSRWSCGKRSRSWKARRVSNAPMWQIDARSAGNRSSTRSKRDRPVNSLVCGARPHVDHEHAVERDEPLVDGQHPRVVRMEPLDLGVDLQARQPPRPARLVDDGHRIVVLRVDGAERDPVGEPGRGVADPAGSAPGTFPGDARTRRTRSARRRRRGGRPPPRPARWGRSRFQSECSSNHRRIAAKSRGGWRCVWASM